MQNRLLEIGKRVLAESDVRRVLTVALDGIVELCAADRGMILLFGPGGEEMFEEARGLGRQDIERPEFEVSRTLIEKVRGEGTAFWSPNVLADPGLAGRRSVMRLQILSVICLPIRQGGEMFGLVYLDNRRMTGVFTEETLAVVDSFADLISLAAYFALERRRLHNRVEDLSRELRGQYRFDAIVGQSPQILETLRLVSQVADSERDGADPGRERHGQGARRARASTRSSPRGDGPFVAVNCARAPRDAARERAVRPRARRVHRRRRRQRRACFEAADGGTLFLDEIGELPLDAPGEAAARARRSGEFAPRRRHARRSRSTCASSPRPTATSRARSRAGSFREDLYYRLNVVIQVELPPLRERASDIPLLARALPASASTRARQARRRALGRTRWRCSRATPGRATSASSQNVIERAVAARPRAFIEPGDLPASLRGAALPRAARGEPCRGIPRRQAARSSRSSSAITSSAACARTEGNISQAARAAGIDVKNFYDKMSRYGIDALEFRKGRG